MVPVLFPLNLEGRHEQLALICLIAGRPFVGGSSHGHDNHRTHWRAAS